MSYEDEIQSEPACTEYTLLAGSELTTIPAVQWVIKGLVPGCGLALIYGPTRSGKSFLALDMAMAISRGTPFFGRRVRQSPVVMFPLEGSANEKRVAAWVKHHRVPVPENFRAVKRKPFALPSQADIDGIVAAVLGFAREGAILFIDTLARAMEGADENSTEDMSTVVRAADEIARRVGGLVVLVHHTGKDGDKGPRGSTVLMGAADAAIEVKRTTTTDVREWKATKVKDGEDGEKYSFDLVKTSLGFDEDNDEITSCIVQRSEAPEPAAGGLGGNQLAVFDAIKLALTTAPTGVAYAPRDVKALTGVEARKVGRAALRDRGVESKHLASRFNEAIGGLLGNGVLKTGGPAPHPSNWKPALESSVWLA